MVFKGIFGFGKKENTPPPDPVVAGDDGWVEVVGGKVVVHDPTRDGKYATITPEGSVRLFVNDEEIKEPTAVMAADRVRFEVNADPLSFFEVAVAPDRMTATLQLTADPNLVPDTVAVNGRHQVRLVPTCSPKARQRPASPRQLIGDRLRELRVVFGVDEAAIDRELAGPTYQAVVIARGQEPVAPVAGEWIWKLDELSLVDPGQVIAAYQGGQVNQPRIRVSGEEEKVFEEIPQPQVYLAGNGTRLMPGGRLVASASGRARGVPTPQGHRVHLFPVERIDGDVEADLHKQTDLIIQGSVKGCKIATTGEILVIGNVEKAELRAEVITVRGASVDSTLCTTAPGHHASLRGELVWLQTRVEAMRELVRTQKPVPEEAFREVLNVVRAQRRKVEQMGVRHPEYQAAGNELARVFMGTPRPMDLQTAGNLILVITKALKAAEHAAARDVRVASMNQTVVWAGRDIVVEEKASHSSLFSGGAIRSPEACTFSQCELVAGGDVCVGILATARGSTPVNIRFGGRVEVEEAQMGSSFECLAERKTFERDQQRMIITPNSKGQMIFRHKE